MGQHYVSSEEGILNSNTKGYVMYYFTHTDILENKNCRDRRQIVGVLGHEGKVGADNQGAREFCG